MPRDLIDPPYSEPPEWEPGARTVGATFRARRVAAGVTLRRCAEAMGISMTDLSAIERGTRPMGEDERRKFEEVVR